MGKKYNGSMNLNPATQQQHEETMALISLPSIYAPAIHTIMYLHFTMF